MVQTYRCSRRRRVVSWRERRCRGQREMKADDWLRLWWGEEEHVILITVWSTATSGCSWTHHQWCKLGSPGVPGLLTCTVGPSAGWSPGWVQVAGGEREEAMWSSNCHVQVVCASSVLISIALLLSAPLLGMTPRLLTLFWQLFILGPVSLVGLLPWHWQLHGDSVSGLHRCWGSWPDTPVFYSALISQSSHPLLTGSLCPCGFMFLTLVSVSWTWLFDPWPSHLVLHQL